MNIPEGFKLVPTELLERVVCLDNGFRQHRQAQYDLVNFLSSGSYRTVDAPHAAWQRRSKEPGGEWFPLPSSDVKEAIRLGYQVRKLYTRPVAGEIDLLRAQLEEKQSSAEMFYQKQILAETKQKNAERRAQTLRETLQEAQALLKDAIAEVEYCRGQKPGCRTVDLEKARDILAYSGEG